MTQFTCPSCKKRNRGVGPALICKHCGCRFLDEETTFPCIACGHRLSSGDAGYLSAMFIGIVRTLKSRGPFTDVTFDSSRLVRSVAPLCHQCLQRHRLRALGVCGLAGIVATVLLPMEVDFSYWKLVQTLAILCLPVSIVYAKYLLPKFGPGVHYAEQMETALLCEGEGHDWTYQLTMGDLPYMKWVPADHSPHNLADYRNVVIEDFRYVEWTSIDRWYSSLHCKSGGIPSPMWDVKVEGNAVKNALFLELCRAPWKILKEWAVSPDNVGHLSPVYNHLGSHRFYRLLWSDDLQIAELVLRFLTNADREKVPWRWWSASGFLAGIACMALGIYIQNHFEGFDLSERLVGLVVVILAVLAMFGIIGGLAMFLLSFQDGQVNRRLATMLAESLRQDQ